MDAVTAEVEAAMLALVGTDNERIAHATSFVRAFMGKKQAAVSLFMLLQHSQHEAVRQLSAILFRRDVLKFWNRLPGENRQQVKMALLQRLTQEPSRAVRRALVSVVAGLAKALLPANDWPELLSLLDQCAQQPMEEARSLAMILVRELSEMMGPNFEPIAVALKPLIVAGLNDPMSAPVRVASLRALGSVLLRLEKKASKAAYQDTIPAMVTRAQACLADGTAEEAGVEALEVLSDLADANSSLLKPYTEPLLRFLAFAMVQDGLDEGTKDAANDVVTSLVTARPKNIAKMGLAESVLLPAAFTMAATYDAEEEEEREREAREAGIEVSDSTLSAPWHIAGRLCATMGECLPSKYVYHPLVRMATEWMKSPDWHHRRAALDMLGTAVEGCRDLFIAHMRSLLDLVLPHAKDAAPPVRDAVGFVLQNFSEHLGPRMVFYDKVILPAALAMLDDPNHIVVCRGCYVIDSFVNQLSEATVLPFLEGLMSRLAALVGRPGAPPKMYECAIDAMSTVVLIARRHVTPYVGGLMPGLLGILAQTEPALLRSRARATELAARVGVAVGKEAFAPYAAPCIQAAIAGADLDLVELEEMAWLFFGLIAEALGSDMAQLLPQLVPRLCQCVESSAGFEVRQRAGSDEGGLGGVLDGLVAQDEEDGEGGEGDEEDEDEDDRDCVFRVFTSAMEVKAAAVCALGRLALFVGDPYVPYFEHTFATLSNSLLHHHISVREESAIALSNFVVGLKKAYPPTPAPAPFAPAVLHPTFKQYYDQVTLLFIEAMLRESEALVVASVCMSWVRFCEELGAVAVWNCHENLIKAFMPILRERATCQLTAEDLADDDEEEGEAAGPTGGAGAGFNLTMAAPPPEEDEDAAEEDDSAEHDHVLMDEVTEALLAIIRCTGPAFAVYADRVLKGMQRYAKASRPVADRLMAVGFFADFAQANPDVFAPYATRLTGYVVSGVGNEDPDLRRNALFSGGVILEKCGASAFGSSLPAFVRGVLATLSRGREDPEENAAIDNAIATFCRVMNVAPSACPPLSASLPPLLALMPTVADREEDTVIFEFLLGLLSSRNPVAMGSAPAVLALAGKELLPTSGATAKAQELVAARLRALFFTASEAEKASLAAVVAALPEPVNAAVRAALGT